MISGSYPDSYRGWETFPTTTTSQLPTSKPISPFQLRTPKHPKTLTITRVGRDNLAQLAYRIVSMSDLAVWIPNGRSCIQIGDKRFDLGEWIIEESDEDVVKFYRHPTESEVDAYGLKPVELEG